MIAQLSVQDASVVEGNDGTSTASFIVQLSRPVPNPVTFDIATSNGSATAGSNYLARSQHGRYSTQPWAMALRLGPSPTTARRRPLLRSGREPGSCTGADDVFLPTPAPIGLGRGIGPLHRLPCSSA